MPGRNITRNSTEDTYYHVYNRGVNKRKIFLNDDDYRFFLSLFERYVNTKPTKDSKGREYRWLGDQVEVMAYCLMPNHFHLLLYQISAQGISELLLSVSTAYVMYFNKKYRRRGPLFENTYRASMINSDAYLEHVSRYIHLNPRNYMKWPYSSLSQYIHIPNIPGAAPGTQPWVHTDRVLEQFPNRKEYLKFVKDYEAAQRELESIKHELADH